MVASYILDVDEKNCFAAVLVDVAGNSLCIAAAAVVDAALDNLVVVVKRIKATKRVQVVGRRRNFILSIVE